MKVGLIGTYVFLAFQKPFRESPSSETSHSRSRGTFHDRNGKTAATKIPRSAGDAARLCARYHLPSSLDGAECKSDSLVGGNSKRMMLPPLSSSCVGSDSRRVISPSLTTPNFSVRRRMMSSRHRKQPLPWHCQRHSLRHTGTLLVLPMRKHEKSGKVLEAASLLSEMRPGLFLVIDIMLFGSDIYSLFPTVQHHGDPRHHLRHPLPSLHRRVRHLRLIPDCPSPITNFKHAKKLPLTGEFFHSADAEIILRS